MRKKKIIGLNPDDRISHRVQFDLSEQAIEKLDDLVEKNGFSSRVGALRYGLRILKWVVACQAEEKEVLVKKRDGEEIGIIFLSFT